MGKFDPVFPKVLLDASVHFTTDNKLLSRWGLKLHPQYHRGIIHLSDALGFNRVEQHQTYFFILFQFFADAFNNFSDFFDIRIIANPNINGKCCCR
jgi:hypothetical protein